MIAPYTFQAHQRILINILVIFEILRFTKVHRIIVTEGDEKCMVDIYVFGIFEV